MNYTDFIKMNSISMYNITFPTKTTDELIEKLNTGEFNSKENTSFEIIKNPLSEKKIIELENGIFFSIRAEFKKFSKEMVANKMYEIHLKGQADDVADDIEKIARVELFNVIPPSTEIYNFFYNTETNILVVNSSSTRSKTAVAALLDIFGLIGVSSIIVSSDQLGLTAKFEQYLNDRTRIFNGIGFDYVATFRRVSGSEKSFLTLKRLHDELVREQAKTVLENGFHVQSLQMDIGEVKFKVDEHLKIRGMKFRKFSWAKRKINNSDYYSKRAIFLEYISEQFDLLNRITNGTVLEFTQNTNLENFVEK